MRNVIKTLSVAAALFSALSCFAQKPQNDIIPISSGTLAPERIEQVYVAPGRLTTIVLDTKRKIDLLAVGSPIVEVNYDSNLNQIQIKPLVESGETNMNVRIGKDTYVIILHVVNDVRVQYLRTFTLIGSSDEDETTAAMSSARPLKPSEIDVVGSVKKIERARRDVVYRNTQPMLKTFGIGAAHQWNNCFIYLVEVTQIADQDLLVFKLEWVNRTNNALYLDATQYKLRVANRKVPILAWYQKAANSTVYPGQHETVYLFVQGLRLRPQNEWELSLPPDASGVQKLLKGY